MKFIEGTNPHQTYFTTLDDQVSPTGALHKMLNKDCPARTEDNTKSPTEYRPALLAQNPMLPVSVTSTEIFKS